MKNQKHLEKSVKLTEMERQGQQNYSKKRSAFPSKESPVARVLWEEDVATKTKKPNVVRKKHVPPIVDTHKGHKQKLENSGLNPKYIYKKDFGEIPLYLQQRKKEQEAHEEFLNKNQQETIKQVSDEERKITMELLKKKLDELNSEYLCLPLVICTFSKQKYKKELEENMMRLEEYICLLESKNIIYYDTDSEESETEDVSQVPQIKKKLQTQNQEDIILVNHPKMRCVPPLSNTRIKQSEGQETLRKFTPLQNKGRRILRPQSVELGKYQSIKGNLTPLPPISYNKQSTKWRLIPEIQQNEPVLRNVTPLPPISTNKSERKVLTAATGIKKTEVTMKMVELTHLPDIPKNKRVYMPTPPPKTCPSTWESKLKHFKNPNSLSPPVRK